MDFDKVPVIVKKLEESAVNQCESESIVSNETVFQVTCRATRSRTAALSHVCTICNCKSHSGDNKLSTFSELKRAELFLQITNHYKDDVFKRCLHFSCAKDIIESEIYYHKNCLRAYELKYKKDIAIEVSVQQIVPENVDENYNDAHLIEDESLENCSAETKSIVISRVVNTFISRIQRGEIITLSAVRDAANKLNPELNITNVNIKNFLQKNYGDAIQFYVPSDQKQSTFIYDSKLSLEQIFAKLQPKNIMKESAKIIKAELTAVHFDLEDKFIDESNVKAAWENSQITENLLFFFRELFNFRRRSIKSSDNSESKLPEHKSLKMKSLFQIMVYILKSGKIKSPLHLMIGLVIHNTCKSKSLIQSLNHLGLSASYDQILRCRTSLALYTIQSCFNIIPLPSNIDRTKFTKGAFDNFDHNEASLSGLNSTHDTACVLFQESGNCLLQKPRISTTGIDKNERSLNEMLQCQTLKPFYKPAGNIVLSANYSKDSISLSPSMFESANSRYFAWYMCRMDLTNISRCNENKKQTTPTWSAFNSIVNEDTRKTENVGFLPVLPHPVTEFSTVYTAMCNFNDILSQLDQKYFPLFCDEGVYRIARHIQLVREGEFKDIVLMMGSFHMTKVLCTCIGNYLNNSGVEQIFIETEIFGVSIVEQILNGSHYSRCTKGFFMLGEALQRLQIESFFEAKNANDYDNELITLKTLQDTFAEKSFEECKTLYKNFCENSSDLVQDFKDFVIIRCEESPLFKYWTNVLILIQLLKDLIRADRIGDWILHVNTVKKLLPILIILDRTNYTRWCSLYLQDILNLQETKPELYAEFLAGKFTVKRSSVPFTSVATDQGLEQTINKSQKSSSGIIGSTQKKEYITAWNLTHHELLAVKNYFKEITRVSVESDELTTHHELSVAITDQSENDVDKILKYIMDHCNPYIPGKESLKNIVTHELKTNEEAEALLNIFENACSTYKKFFSERFVDKLKSLSDTIPKVNYLKFKSNSQIKSASQKNVSIAVQNKCAERMISLAKERNYSLRVLFTFELTNINLLFNEDGTLKKEKSKSDLVKELETAYLCNGMASCIENLINTALIVDVMLKCRQIKWTKLKTFRDFASAFCSSISCISKKEVSRIDFVFDSYVDNSLKSDERLVRYKECPIDMHVIDEEVRMPKQEKQFWGSKRNKVLLQNFLRKFILQKSNEFWPGITILYSATNEMPCQSNLTVPLDTFELLQRSDIEEADSRIIIHIFQCCIDNIEKVFVLSSDTDVFVLLLHYWPTFKSKNLQKLWVQVGAASKKRILPIHDLAENCGKQICFVLPALHHLTGADYTSKMGTKHGALSANPERYLTSFAQGISQSEIDESIVNAEKYLIRVIKKTNATETFDELRYAMYHHSSRNSISELVPTSASIRLHILRAFYHTYEQINILKPNRTRLIPENFGYCYEGDYLVPKKVKCIYPSIDDLVPNCNCQMCSTKACNCVSAGLSCTTFCNCQKNASCKNKYKME